MFQSPFSHTFSLIHIIFLFFLKVDANENVTHQKFVILRV